MKRSNEPFLWSLFSAGGMLSALTLPAVVGVLWIAPAFGWLEPVGREEVLELLAPALARLAVFALVALSLFHWAHRFRFTLFDGLQLKHLFGLIATVCYGGATVLTLLAGFLLWRL